MFLLNRFRVGTRLGAGFVLVLLLMVGMIVVSLGQMQRQHSSLEEISGEFRERISLIHLMRDSVRFQAIALRDVVAQEDISFKKGELKQMREARKRYKEASENLARLMADPGSQSRMEEIRKLEEDVAAAVAVVMEATLSEEHEAARNGIRDGVRPRQIALVTALEALQQDIEARGLSSAEEATSSYRNARNILLSMGVAAFVFGLLIAWAITRSIVGPLLQSVGFASRIAAGDLTARIDVSGEDELAQLQGSLDDMAEHLSTIIREVHQAAERASAATESLAHAADDGVSVASDTSSRILEVGDAMASMTASIDQVSEGARTVGEAAATAQRVSIRGNDYVSQGEQAIGSVVSGMSSYAEAICGLNGSIQEISAITAVIREIADQTNLLALNAAIEAARAGEAGRGFAVVADEVRLLAEKTTRSTESISNKVKGISEQANGVVAGIHQINDAVSLSASLSSKTSGILAEILTAAGKVVSEAGQIKVVAEQQSQARQNTGRAVDHITALAGREANSMQEIGRISQELRKNSEQLRELISRFHT